ncbi:MAG: HAD-IC family P-type ATPase [Patescibacteria group bacterium]|nr:HAD-IC family P-type ATPase [Patescibacteria group bacterium]
MAAITDSHNGLRDADIIKLRQQYGWNELPEFHENVLILYLKNFWGPLPWLMELVIVITVLSGDTFEGILIACLLILNGFISLYQRRSADAALATLRKAIQITVRVRRNNLWGTLPGRELVPGDVIRLRAGDIVPADAEIFEGDISVDLSSLTGESLPRDMTVGDKVFSGGIVRHGESTARVSSIGLNTEYGKTTELLEVAHPPTHMEKVVFSIIKYFFTLNIVVAAFVVVFGLVVHAPILQITNFVIVLLLMSVPVAFPTMFAVAQTYGALQLSAGGKTGVKGNGVLVRRLAAVQEGAIMDVLCSDKTGTLTQNLLSVKEICVYGDNSEKRLLGLAAACSDIADEDSIDQAIIERATESNIDIPKHQNYMPFDSATKRTEAEIVEGLKTIHIKKGLADLLLDRDTVFSDKALKDVSIMSQKGLRVLAVIASEVTVPGGKPTTNECVGLIGLADPIRPDAPDLIRELNKLGVRLVMITGDGRATAQAVANELGLSGKVFTPEDLKKDPKIALDGGVFAEAYPDDKLEIVRALQNAGHVVGMTGDGVNDAPALHQAEVGIAVLGATEVAKQAASFILMSPGLDGIRRVVTASRRVYMRIRTWALNKVVKSIEVLFVTTIIFLLTDSYILSPLLAVLVMLANDFVTISIATDHTKPLLHPARWKIFRLVMASSLVALPPFIFTMFIYFLSIRVGYPIDVIRTIMYCSLIYLGKSTFLSVRAWPYGWSVRPSMTVIVALLFSLIFTSVIAGFGIFIAAMPPIFFAIIIAGSIASFFFIEIIKRLRFVHRMLDIE